MGGTPIDAQTVVCACVHTHAGRRCKACGRHAMPGILEVYRGSGAVVIFPQFFKLLLRCCVVCAADTGTRICTDRLGGRDRAAPWPFWQQWPSVRSLFDADIWVQLCFVPVFEAPLPFMSASRCLGPGKALFLQTLCRQARQAGQVAGVAFDDLWRYIHVRDLAARLWFIEETSAQEITPQEVEVVPSGPLDWLPAHLTEIREADVQGIRPQEVEV